MYFGTNKFERAPRLPWDQGAVQTGGWEGKIKCSRGAGRGTLEPKMAHEGTNRAPPTRAPRAKAQWARGGRRGLHVLTALILRAFKTCRPTAPPSRGSEAAHPKQGCARTSAQSGVARRAHLARWRIQNMERHPPNDRPTAGPQAQGGPGAPRALSKTTFPCMGFHVQADSQQPRL